MITKFFNVVKPLIVAIFSVIVTNELLTFICSVDHQHFHKSNVKNSTVISSIWCSKDHGDVGHKICVFENLCWLPKEEQFVIFITEESVVAGVDSYKELSEIDFTSVEGHNRFSLKLAVITNSIGENHPFSQYQLHKENEWVFFVWRFKPDNIMHVLHDDLLPMYYTYEGICGGNVERCINDYKLVFVDDVTSVFSSDLYELFSKENSHLGDGRPVFLRNYWRNYSDSLICFKHARVGISRATTWFQYGFGKPQGAIENSKVTVSVFRKFSQFLIQKMGLQSNGFQCKEDKLPPRALFLTRNISRRILNEKDVMKTMRKVYSSVVGSTLNVKHINPFSDSALSEVREILKVVMDLPPVSFVFGMHGAALTVVTLLSLGANIGCNPLAIMELFPMGIDPDAVSPIKALAKLPWLQNSIIYESWTNKDPANSKMPSTYLHPLQGGGLMCKGMDLRETLRAVHCCHNKEYICRMFQDTIVDLKGEYLDKLRLLFTQQKEFKQDNMTVSHQEFKWYFPAPVTNVSCRWNLEILVLELLWKQSLNVHNQIHHYDITVVFETEKVTGKDDQLQGNGDAYLKNSLMHHKKDYFLKVSEPHALLAIPEEFVSLPKIIRAMVWIQCVVELKHWDKINQRKSLDTYHTCSTSL